MENENFNNLRFDLPKDQSSIIKVIGVGGGGSNAVNYMYEQGINGVDFIVCNTDSQALDKSPVPTKIQLGASLTEGRGAGSKPEVGMNAAVETIDEVKEVLGNNTTMVFITAGMGGGTGTGAAPIIAQAAKEMNILTVGIVTVPFVFEGKRRKNQADSGLERMREAVDTLLVITNDKLRELYGNLSLKKAFGHADEVLCTAAKGIAEVITIAGEINVDMNDVNTVMRDSGVAIMGSGQASGGGRAKEAVSLALESPLLNDNDITGANYVLLNITYGNDEVTMDEISEITDYIQDAAGHEAEVIFGYGEDEKLAEDLSVTVIATGFECNRMDDDILGREPKVTKISIDAEPIDATPISKPIENPLTPGNIIKHPLMDNDVNKQEVDNSEIIYGNDNGLQQGALFEDIKDEKADEVSFKHPTLDTPPAQPTIETQEEEVKTTFDFNGPGIVNDDFDQDITDKGIIIVEEKEEIRDDRPSRDDLTRINEGRQDRIMDVTSRLKTPSGLSDLENEPAYVRRNVDLDDVQQSQNTAVSRFSLNEDVDEEGNRIARLRDNNPFLHDNVD